MKLSVFELINLGYKYLKLWPKQSKLSNYFDDYQAIQMARFVLSVCPSIAILAFIANVYFDFGQSIAMALTYSLFILSMVPQALVMLGVKADKYLPHALASWYKEGVARYNEQGGNIKLSLNKPRYIDLAQLLNLTFSKQKFN